MSKSFKNITNPQEIQDLQVDSQTATPDLTTMLREANAKIDEISFLLHQQEDTTASITRALITVSAGLEEANMKIARIKAIKRQSIKNAADCIYCENERICDCAEPIFEIIKIVLSVDIDAALRDKKEIV